MELERLCTTCWKVSHYNRYLICFSPPLLQASYYKFNIQSSPMPSFNILLLLAAAAKSLQSCLTLCDPRDRSPPGSSVHGIFQARVGCHFLPQGIFLTQDRTWVSHVVGRCFTVWTIREVKEAHWKQSYVKPRQCIKKQRCHFAHEGLYSQSYGFFQ